MIDVEIEALESRGLSAPNSFAVLIGNVEPNKQDLELAGDYIVPQIQNRTLSGVDYRGEAFAQYSPRYAKRKGSGTVTLYGSHSGEHMLDAIQAKAHGGSSLEVGVFGDEQLAARARALNEGARVPTRAGTGAAGGRRRRVEQLKAYSIIPARRFLGASQQELDEMARLIAESALKRASKKG